MRPVAALALMMLLVLTTVCPAQEAAEEEEEKPYDEIGFFQDDVRLSLSFTKGSTDRYDYEDLRIYLIGQAHYAFKGDDYLNLYLFINRFDRAYDDPRYSSEPLTNILDVDLTYVFGGVDKWTYGFNPIIGATFFSDDMFNDVDFGLGYGCSYNYQEGSLHALAGLGRNLGYTDDWSPMLDLGWTHNKRFSPKWSLRTKADVMWNESRSAAPDDGRRPEAVYLLDGQLNYQVIKYWSLYLRYYNDNSVDRSRSYVSFGVSHNFRRPRPRR